MLLLPKRALTACISPSSLAMPCRHSPCWATASAKCWGFSRLNQTIASLNLHLLHYVELLTNDLSLCRTTAADQSASMHMSYKHINPSALPMLTIQIMVKAQAMMADLNSGVKCTVVCPCCVQPYRCALHCIHHAPAGHRTTPGRLG